MATSTQLRRVESRTIRDSNVRGIRPRVRLLRLCCTLLFSWREATSSVGMPINKVDNAEATET